MKDRAWPLCALALWALAARGAAAGALQEPAVRLWADGAWREYDVTSELLLNEAARRDRPVGWRLGSTLAVRAVARHQDDVLLHFQLRAPSLQLRGAASGAEWAARPSVWDAASLRSSQFAARWRAGRLTAAFLPPADAAAVADHRRALLALFQFHILDTERNETDVSGDCAVLYETLAPHEFRKIKRACTRDGAGGAEGGTAVRTRSVARYTLRPELDALAAVHAEEVHEIADAAGGAAVKARSWLRLELRGTQSGAPPELGAGALEAATAALEPALREASLVQPSREDEEEREDILEPAGEGAREMWAALRAWEEPAEEGGAGDDEGGAAGERAAVAALLALLPGTARASPRTLRALLDNATDHAHLVSAARLLGATGTGAALAAATDALQLRAEPHAPAARAVLAALALAPRPQPAAVRAARSLAADARQPGVRRAALLAAAAAAPRAGPDAEAAVRDELAAQLARCKDEACRAGRLAALGNLRRADTAGLLLEHVERAPPREPAAALAALRALRELPPAALGLARAARLAHLALDEARALELRAAALDLCVVLLADTPLPLLSQVARRLHRSREQHELRRMFWQRLRELSATHEAVRDFLRAALDDSELGSWHAQAHAGTSAVLTREAARGAGGWAGVLDGALLAGAGVLRRGRLALRLQRGHERLPALDLELWTTGLHALAGAGAAGAAEGAPAEEDAAAGLELAVAGRRLPPVDLFSGQAELLGHVWAGTGSTPTPVLRAPLPLGEHTARVPLLAGGEALFRTRAAAALALDARASASLWARTAAVRLELRAAHRAHSEVRARTAWGSAAAGAAADTSARLAIAADLDFYSAVALCVRASLDSHEEARRAALRSQLGARRWRVRRSREASARRPGRELALGRQNDAACRALAPAA